jgi:beta-glucanase (GH16 family)
MESLTTKPNIKVQKIMPNRGKLLPSLASLLLISFSPPSLAGWEVQWIDTFEGNSVNWDNWTAQTKAFYNNEVQCYTDDDSSSEKNYDVSDGTLKIIARKKDNFCSTISRNQSWTSGRLNSKHKREFLYGRIESRIRFQNAEQLLSGTWPAFWALENRINQQPIASGDDVSWPNAGASEIDIWEWFNNSNWYPNGAPDFYITNFFNEVSYDSPVTTACGSNVSYNYPNGAADVQNWHNYAMEWSADEISFYIDETLVVTQDLSNCNQYQDPMFVLLNVAMGGNLGGPIDPDLTKVTMEVDYVAHCQASDANSATYCNEELVEPDNGELNVTINVSQRGVSVVEINPENGPVTLNANANNLNSETDYSYEWTIDKLPSAITLDDKVIFDPASMQDGSYDVSVKLTDQQQPEYNDSDALTLKVKASSTPTPTPIPSESSSGGSTNQLVLVLLGVLCLCRRRLNLSR